MVASFGGMSRSLISPLGVLFFSIYPSDGSFFFFLGPTR